MKNELRFAFRTLRRSPVFTASAVACLALGIGANTAIFSLLDQVLLRSLPVADPERLVLFHSEGQDPGAAMADNMETVYSYPMYKSMRDRAQAFEGLIARSGAAVTVQDRGTAERGGVELVSGNFFDVLGILPAIGRTLHQSDDLTPGAHPVIVLGHAYWTKRFGGDPQVLNRKLLINGHPMIVVGVASRHFRGIMTGNTPDMFIPIAMRAQVSPGPDILPDFTIRWLSIFGRLKRGITVQRAGAMAQAVFKAIRDEDLPRVRHMGPHEKEEYLNRKLELQAASQGINQLRWMWRTPLLVIMAMVGLLLLIACANVGNLLIARAAGRRKEIAVRVSLGAGRGTILRQLLVESVVLSLAGGVIGTIIARWTAAGLLSLLPEGATDGWVNAQIDLRMLGYAFGVSLLTGLIFGCAPAVQIWSVDLTPASKNQTGGVGLGLSQTRFRRVVVAAQIALALILLVGAGLFARSLLNLMNTDTGFRPQNLLTFSLDPKLNGYDTPRGFAFLRALRERLGQLPGVEAVTATTLGPFGNGMSATSVSVEGYQPARPDEEPGAELDAVAPGYFRATGIPLLAGREFTERDNAAAPQVAIISEAFAKQYFRNRDPLGRKLGATRDQSGMEIVGVVRDIRYADLRKTEGPFLYTPYEQDKSVHRLTFYVRGYGSQLGANIRRTVRDLDPNLPISDIESMEVRIGRYAEKDRMLAFLAGAFGVLATLLSAIGLYGIIAYSVARRTSEIGIRMALGAGRGRVVWLVMRELAWVVAAGTAVGGPVAFALARFVESELYGIRAHDPAMFAAAIGALAASALLAGFIPARRAAAIEPVQALRYE